MCFVDFIGNVVISIVKTKIVAVLVTNTLISHLVKRVQETSRLLPKRH